MENHLEYLGLILASVAAGGINAIAGGGTLLTFPALFALLGMSDPAAVTANATSTVALFPASLAATYGYRQELLAMTRWARILLVPSLVGGLAGSLAVVALPDSSFATLVPWLILLAALLFALQPQISRWTAIGRPHATDRRMIAAAMLFQLGVAIYGGYFGAGIGILMLSALALMGMSNIHEMNALKCLLAACINGVAVVVFVVMQAVNWPLAFIMAISAIAGAYGAARVARRLDTTLVRRFVVAIGFALATYYFYRQLTGSSA